MSKTHKYKTFFFAAAFFLTTSTFSFATEEASVAARGGGGGGDRGGGDRGAGGHFDNRGNLDHRGQWGDYGGGWGGGYAAPVYPDYPYYIPPPTPAEAFPDDAAQDSMYQRNQHPPIPR